MKDKYFLDTNIFIYSFDANAPAKRKKAQSLVDKTLITGNGVISYQVVQEFLNVCTRKFAIPFSMFDIKTYLEQVLVPLCEVYPSSELYLFALDIQEHSKYTFYDSLIVAAAIKSGCNILYSEDLQNGRKIGSLEINNPFG